MKWRILSLGAALWMSSMSSLLLFPAEATRMVLLPFDALVDQAEQIIRSSVVSHHSFWRKGRIVTHYRLKAQDTLKGIAQTDLVVESLGGRVGELGQHVHGMAHFDRGQDVVLFLRKDPKEAVFRAVGMWQGAFLIQNGDAAAKGADRQISHAQRLDRVEKAGPEADALVWHDARSGDMPASYAALKSRVQERLQDKEHR